MATLATAISAAITKNLLAKLPTEAAKKFDLDDTEFKEFLQGFLSSQLGRAAKSGRSAGPKGINGKGRISGYILFSNENREDVNESNPDLKFTDVGKELGRMWRELTDDDKNDWNTKAAAQNEANGLPAPGAKAAQKGKTTTKATTKATAKSASDMKITRHQASNSWVIPGTIWVVHSPKNKTVIGKLRADKVVALSAIDRKKCETSGWTVKAPVKAAPVKATAKSKAKAPVEDDESEDDDDDDDVAEDHSDDEDSQDEE
uniref:High mobility group box n=1 Tax=Marseillevirus LCMAC202 TaxID=2506606 RepID=A0A481YXU9_9VIRU|nr:MAG: high mobility group box [Marseillevirus LCMAC202]